MKNQISIHFDGPIAKDHAVDLRTFSKTLEHVQSAIERAYLDVKYGTIWKNARLKDEDYKPTSFLMKQTREGGFITDLLGNKESRPILERIQAAVEPAHEAATLFTPKPEDRLVDLAENRRKHYNAGAQKPTAYEKLINTPDQRQTQAYGDRSIVKEFDQIASAIRARNGDGSFIEIDVYAGRAFPTLVFDGPTSESFHKIVATRTLGDPVKIPITLRALDSGNGGISKAKATNLVSGKEFNLHIHTVSGFGSLKKYLKKRNPPEFNIIACPVLEYGAFDPLAGDMYLIGIDEDL